MKKHLLTAAIVCAAAFGSASAADADPVLMTVGGHDIRVSEFEYLYNKNNTQQEQPQTLDEYREMFINYKLKVADAEAAGLDTLPAFRNEYNRYRIDLSRPYLRDASIEERLVNEAYDRRRTTVKVSHIMMPLDDSARTTLDSLRREILAGHITFEDAAAQYSVDRGSKTRGGLMGYVDPDRYPYAFEKAAHETAVGELSPVVNSGVGYHLIRVEEKKPSDGEVLVEHILLLTRNLPDSAKAAVRVKIDSLYNLARNGADFGDLARRFSEDRGSATNSGRLDWFGHGVMVAEFDSASFAIPVGAVSEPFATTFGYHIVHKLDSRTLQPLEELRPQILRTMQNDERANLPETTFKERLMEQAKAKIDNNAVKKIRRMIESNPAGYDSAMIATLTATDMIVARYKGGEPIRLAEVMPTVAATLSTDAAAATSLIAGAAQLVLESRVMDQYRDQLAETKPEYRNLLNEYRDGILLYDISNTKVWDRAARDTEGLDKFFRENRDRYAWPRPKFKSFIFFASGDSVLNAAIAYADSLSTDDPAAFAAKMRERFGRDIKVERVIAAQGENPITDYLAFDGDKPSADARSHWAVYAAYKGRILPGPENAADVRGAAVTDYQTELERQWIEELRGKYPVVVNEEVFRNLKNSQR